MREETEQPVEQVEEALATPAFNCANCEDSGKECYVCGAGRQIA